MQQLQRLGDKLNLSYSSSSKFNVSLQLVSSHHLVFNSILHRADLKKNALIDGPRVPERVNRFKKLRGQRLIPGNAAGLDQHHPLPGLAPLRIVILVTREGSAQRTRIAFRPEPQINAIQGSLGSQARDLGDECL